MLTTLAAWSLLAGFLVLHSDRLRTWQVFDGLHLMPPFQQQPFPVGEPFSRRLDGLMEFALRSPCNRILRIKWRNQSYACGPGVHAAGVATLHS